MTAMYIKTVTPRTTPMKMQNRMLILLFRSKDTLRSWVILTIYSGQSKDEDRRHNL